MKYTYLLIDFFSILVPFLFSFHPKVRFYKKWPAFLPAAIITGILFITWDICFTHLKIWGFNPSYITGIYIGNLPLEEILFFLCIPYACVFTYHCLNVSMKQSMSKNTGMIITILLIAGAVLLAVFFHYLMYTAFAFAFLAMLLFAANVFWRVSWLPKFYVTYLILLLPFLIVNGILTGTGLNEPIVWYNPIQILNLRILTIPVEDVFYGMDLILLNVLIYSWLCQRNFERLKIRRKANTSFKIEQI